MARSKKDTKVKSIRSNKSKKPISGSVSEEFTFNQLTEMKEAFQSLLFFEKMPIDFAWKIQEFASVFLDEIDKIMNFRNEFVLKSYPEGQVPPDKLKEVNAQIVEWADKQKTTIEYAPLSRKEMGKYSIEIKPSHLFLLKPLMTD